MGLFKSAEEKRMEERMLVKKAESNIRRYLERLEEAKRRYIEEAKTAKANGIRSQYNLARSGLGMAVQQSRVAEQLLLNMELSRQNKDASEVTRDFVTGMETLGKEIEAQSGRIRVGRAQKHMRKAMAQSGAVAENLSEFMEETELLFGSGGESANARELDEMIARSAAAEEDASAAEVDAALDSLLRGGT